MTGMSPSAHTAVPSIGFAAQQGALCCDAAAVADIVQAVGTPCYVYSAGIVAARLAALAGALRDTPHSLHYALKANSTLGLVRLLRSLGARADANSIGEIEVARRAGYVPDEILFTGVGKTRDEIGRAVALDLRAINAESAGELARIDEAARAHGRIVRVALRVNPDVDARTHPHITTGQRHNKFGVPLDQAAPILAAASRRPGLRVVGLHVHLGSQMTSLEPIARAAEAVVPLARALLADGVPLAHVDLGGGLGISYEGAAEPDLGAYAAILTSVARETGLSIVVEPGRTLVGPAGALVGRVVDVKPRPGGSFVVLDAGMTELMRPALYSAYHRIVPVHVRDRAPVRCDIVGPVCESSDILGLDRELPLPEVDDLIAVLDAGAYGSAMASNYNRRPLPAEVLVEGGAWRVIRRRQGLDEMLAQDVV